MIECTGDAKDAMSSKVAEVAAAGDRSYVKAEGADAPQEAVTMAAEAENHGA